MARIIYGALATIRGSIGGTTFQSNKHGYTVKNKPNMSKPDSESQNATKRAVVKCTQAWSALDIGIRDTWDSYAISFPQYAKHNIASKLSGFEVFLLRNLPAYIYGGYILMEPSMVSTVNPIFAPTLVSTTGSIILTYNASPEPLDVDGFIFSTPGQLSERYIAKNSLRLVTATNNMTDFTDLYSFYMSKFGRYPLPGETVMLGIKCYGDLTGAAYAKQFFNILVA
jgi:hypothetical protein